MKSYLLLILLIISLYVTIMTPSSYSPNYCIVCLCLFLYPAFMIVKKDIKEIGVINFNIFFVLSFFLVSYAFPVFIYPVTGNLSSLLDFINTTVINKCIGLCTCAFLSYAFGYSMKNSVCKFRVNISYIKVIRKSRVLYFTMFFVVLLFSSFFLYTNANDISVDIASYFIILFIVSATILLYSKTKLCKYNSLWSFINDNFFVFSSLLFIVIIYLVIGDRGTVLQICLLLLGIYSIRCKPISLRVFFPLLIIGIVLMYSIRVTRTTDASLANGDVEQFVSASQENLTQGDYAFWEPFSDLTERYVELYLGYYFQENEGGYLYPLKIFSFLAAPLPFFPNLINNALYGIPLSETSIGRIIGKYYGFHAGSHCVIAAYAPWGLPGIVIVFFLFGYFVRHVTINFNSNPYYGVIYFILLSLSIYMPRSSVLDIYRPAVWAIVLLFFWGRSSRLRNNSI